MFLTKTILTLAASGALFGANPVQIQPTQTAQQQNQTDTQPVQNVTTTPVQQSSAGTTTTTQTASTLSAFEQQVVDFTNKNGQKMACQPLKWILP